MTRCPVCGRDLPLDELLVHLFACAGVEPASRFLLAVVVNLAPATAPITTIDIAPGLVFDRERFQLVVSNRAHFLTSLEARLLAYLVDHPYVVLGRGAILAAVWGIDDATNGREVDTYVYRLRRILRTHPDGAGLIVTVRDLGYRYEPPETSTSFHTPSTPGPHPPARMRATGPDDPWQRRPAAGGFA